ncbi:hypothetical protein Sked_03800 [Sanguibacter keddieii DSM 10542]|uniref:Uncharacterized protein n=1 Tax=Sanguibacter keddieii (strain ATCC 51767 / DSM 10542 / NCFB 3025 / ST-74) TaxID=446469 RepID=D1BK70_SANKS|nr:hypothetical protein [Sanguibacter keddieii]ACZ20347.1 hypothetical protein Sked_03800 [Sanguibacter keddieii DSM 10542]
MAEGLAGQTTQTAPVLPALAGLQMLGSDDVGVCVDGVCEIPGAASSPVVPQDQPEDS